MGCCWPKSGSLTYRKQCRVGNRFSKDECTVLFPAAVSPNCEKYGEKNFRCLNTHLLQSATIWMLTEIHHRGGVPMRGDGSMKKRGE
jgi:hypothetical protein